MAICGPQLSIFALVSRRSDLELAITQISQRRQIVTMQLQELMNQDEWYKDSNVKLLYLQDDNFDMQQKKLETDLKAVNSNLEAQEKLLDNNIKKDFAPSMSI